MAALPVPVPLPLQPHDINVLLPPAPVYPARDILAAVKYRQTVHISSTQRPVAQRCTLADASSSLVYEHCVVVQAAMVAAPQAMVPPWLQGIVLQFRGELRNESQQLRREIQNDLQQLRGQVDIMASVLPELKRLTNQQRGDGTLVHYEVVPFVNGMDPTLPPYNLPRLDSVTTIDNLNVHCPRSGPVQYKDTACQMVNTSSKSIENSLNRVLVQAVTSGKDAQLPEIKDTACQMVDMSSKSIENSLNRALVRAVTSGKDAQPPEIEDTTHRMVVVTSAKDAQPPEIEDTA
ncbi:hypothetical protein JOM56_012117 [Amanita muscaria]